MLPAGLKKRRPARAAGPPQRPFAGIGPGYNAHTPLQLAHATATPRWRVVFATPVRYVEDVRSGGARIRPAPVTNLAQARAPHRDPPCDIGVEPSKAPGRRLRPFIGCGKTGTARCSIPCAAVLGQQKCANACAPPALHCHAPAEAPDRTRAVLVENGGFGASAAAPIARRVLDYYRSTTRRKSGSRGCRCTHTRRNPMRQERPLTERRFDPRRWLMLHQALDPALLLILSLLLSYAFVLMVSASPERTWNRR